jgi:hypothetical protein
MDIALKYAPLMAAFCATYMCGRTILIDVRGFKSAAGSTPWWRRPIVMMVGLVILAWVPAAFSYIETGSPTVVHDPPTPGQIQKAAGDEIRKITRERDELKEKLADALRSHPDVPALPSSYRNEMGLGQTASLAEDIADIFRRDSPVTLVLTAPDDENSQRFKEDFRVLLNGACGMNSAIHCAFKDLPNSKTNLDVNIPDSAYSGVTVHQEEDAPSIKFGGPDYFVQILRCFIAHSSTKIPKIIQQLKIDPTGHVFWFQIGSGSPWVPDVEKNEQCAAVHG